MKSKVLFLFGELMLLRDASHHGQEVAQLNEKKN